MLSYLSDWTTYIVVCVVILVIIFLISNFSYTPNKYQKDEVVSDQESSSSEESYSTSEEDSAYYTIYTDRDNRLRLDNMRFQQAMIADQNQGITVKDVVVVRDQVQEPTVEELSEVSSVSVPSLPFHIRNPGYRPASERKPSEPRSKGEKACKEAAKRIFGVPFHSTWPSWLKNDRTGRTLELDLYNDKIRVAIEYQGQQHYKRVAKWQTEEQFADQVRRDKLKAKICKENGIHLIVVPYTCPIDKIEEYIRYYSPAAIREREACPV